MSNKPITYDSWMTRHFILYSKGHYKKSDDVLQDLRTLLSNATGTPEVFYSDEQIYSFLAGTCVECLSRSDLKELLYCFYHKPHFLGSGPSTVEEMIHHMLGLMACIQVREQDTNGNYYDLIELGEPDPRYLPIAKEPV